MVAAGRLYVRTARTLVPLFLALAVVITLAYYLPLPGAALLVPLAVLVVIPAILGSAVLALSSVVLRDRDDPRPPSLAASTASLRPLAREILAAGVLAGMIALAFVVFLRGLGLLLLPLAYGPPILIQVLAVEGKPLNLSWTRTRALMHRNWARVLGALLAVLFLISIFRMFVLTAVYSALQGAGDPATDALLGILQVLVVGFTLPYFATVQYVTYSDLAERSADG